MRVEALGHDDAVDRAVRLQQDLALGQVEVERLALVAATLQHGIAIPQRLQDGVEDRRGSARLCLPSIAACACG